MQLRRILHYSIFVRICMHAAANKHVVRCAIVKKLCLPLATNCMQVSMHFNIKFSHYPLREMSDLVYCFKILMFLISSFTFLDIEKSISDIGNEERFIYHSKKQPFWV